MNYDFQSTVDCAEVGQGIVELDIWSMIYKKPTSKWQFVIFSSDLKKQLFFRKLKMK